MVSTASCLLYLQWPHFEGHAHVPFSSFPEFLVWSPIVPYFLAVEFERNPTEAILATIIFVAIFFSVLGIAFGTLRFKWPGRE
jgi:hypothetical protein